MAARWSGGDGGDLSTRSNAPSAARRYFSAVEAAGTVPSMASPALGEGRVTRERYWQLVDDGTIGPDDRVELWDGVIIAMSPQSTSASSATSPSKISTGSATASMARRSAFHETHHRPQHTQSCRCELISSRRWNSSSEGSFPSARLRPAALAAVSNC